MKLAISEAKKALIKNEVPIGAILVSEGKIIASDHNRCITNNDPTAHAEILTIRSAANKLSNYRLTKTFLYVTMEPCIMCMGAILHARIKKLIFGCYDFKWGACGTLYNFSEDIRLNHKIDVIPGVCENESKNLIQSFFKDKRKLSR